jgi:hypothetical protein
MYDPTALAKHYTQRARGFADLANEESSSARPIYLRLAEIFGQLAALADRFAAELRGESLSDQREEPATPLQRPMTKRPKRKSALRKPALAQALATGAVKPLEESGSISPTFGDEFRH